MLANRGYVTGKSIHKPLRIPVAFILLVILSLAAANYAATPTTAQAKTLENGAKEALDLSWQVYLTGTASSSWAGLKSGQSLENNIPVQGSNLGDTLANSELATPAPGPKPVGLAWGDGRLWVSDAQQQRIYAIDAQTGRVRLSMLYSEATTPRGLEWENGALWIADQASRRLYKVIPGRTGARTVSTLAAPGSDSAPCGLAYGDGALWVSHGCLAQDDHDLIYKINPRTGRVLDSFPAPGQQPEDLAFGGGMLWNVDGATGVIYKIEPASGKVRGVATIPGKTQGPLVGLAHDGASLWVNDASNIYQVKP
jgi:outer membrane protein assembly factor BamB